MKTTLLVLTAAALALWGGYTIGYHRGVQDIHVRLHPNYSVSEVVTSHKTAINTAPDMITFTKSVFAVDTNDIRVVTRTYKIMPEDSLATMEVFTRGGQTNLVRNTHTKDGVVLFRSQSFYHNGAELGSYTYNGAEVAIGSAQGTPYSLSYRFESSNKPISAIIGTIHTNDVTPCSITIVTLDSFGCTNGIFYPRDSSWLRKVNSMPNTFPLPH